MVILFGAMAITMGFGFVTTIYTARVLGVEEFGKLNFAYTIVYYFGLLVLPGMQMVAIREIAKSKNKEEIRQQISATMFLGVSLTIVAFLLLVGFVLFFKRPEQIKYLILLFGCSMMVNSFSVPWVFRGIEKMQYSELPDIIFAILYLNLIFWFVKGPANTVIAPYLSFLVNILLVMMSLYFLLRVVGNIRFSFQPKIIKQIALAAIPLSFFSIFGSALTNIDKLILGFTRSSFELGLYVSAYRCVFIIHIFMRNYYGAMFPVFSRLYHHSFESFKKMISKNANIMFILSMPFAFGIFVLGKPMVNLVFGAKYIQAAPIVQILVWTVIFISINSLFSQGLIASGRQNTVVILLAIQLIITGGLSIAFVPRFGMKASAMAVVTGEAVSFLIYYKEFSKIVFIPIAKFIYKPLFSSLVMIGFLKIYSATSLFFQVSIALSIYLLTLILLRGLPWEDLGLVWNGIFSNKNPGAIERDQVRE